MKPYAAFFDLDHTILDTSSARLYIKYLHRRGDVSSWDLARGTFLSIMHRFGLFATEDVIKKWVMKYRGLSEEATIRLTEKWFAGMVASHIRQGAAAEVARHREAGARTVVLSASTNYGCDPVKRFLGMDDVISTRLAVKEGLFTGELDGDYCYGPVKLTKAMEYCIEHSLDMEDAWYYGDAIADLYIMERVGHPVCVTPDRKLRREARRRGWEIVEW